MTTTLCPTCRQRNIVVNNGCAICLFLQSELNAGKFHQVFDEVFRSDPKTISLQSEQQIYMVYERLPYICTYKAQHRSEILSFVGRALLDSLVKYTVKEEDYPFFDIDDYIIEEKGSRWVA